MRHPRDRRLGGAHGVFGPGRCRPSSGQGQLGVEWLPLEYVCDPDEIVSLIGPPTFYWRDGDGVNPQVGPVLGQVGVPEVGQPTPHRFRDGSLLTQTEFTNTLNTAFRLGAGTYVDPGGLDMIMVCRWHAGVNAGNADRIFNNRGASATNVWQLRYHATEARPYFQVYGNAATISLVPGNNTQPPGAEIMTTAILDADGDTHFVINNRAPITAATPVGTWGSNEGVALGALTAAAGWHRGGIAYAIVWIGAGIADRMTENAYALTYEIQRRAMGIAMAIGQAVPAFSANSAAMWEQAGMLHMTSANLPRAGSDEAIFESEQENKTYRNVNPAAGAIWTVDDASAVLVADDFAAMCAGTVQICRAGVNAYHYNNATGAPRYAYIAGPQTGNVNPHSLSIYARYAAGAGAELGWWDISLGAWTSVGAIVGGYARTELENSTPPDTDCVLCLMIPDGCHLYWILQQCEERDHCSSPIPVWALAATGTRADDDLDTGITVRDNQGSLTMTVSPAGWDTQPGVDQSIVSDGAVDIIAAPTGADNRATLADGTTTLTIITDWTDAAWRDLRASWGPDMYLREDTQLVEGQAAYDGAFPAAGTLHLGLPGGGAYAMHVRNLVLYRDYQHGGPPE